MNSYLYVAPNLADVADITSDGLEPTTERHKVPLHVGPLKTLVDPLEEFAARPKGTGVVVGMERGAPGRAHLRFASRLMRGGTRVWFYWPNETAVEVIDRDRLRSYWNHWLMIGGYRARRWLGRKIHRNPDPGPELAARCLVAAHNVYDDARPAPVRTLAHMPDRQHKIPGVGMYLRTDYWVEISSGGSYGHTCYVAKELAALTERFVAFMPYRYGLLDEYGVQQVVLPPHSKWSDEVSLMGATSHYLPLVRAAVDALQPAYIYERLCLGNLVGATLSAEFGVPYILEYNGSEVSMNQSFGSGGYKYEEVFTKIEDAAFRQATMITVVSDVLKQSLIARQVDPAKILVNPNGADPEAYAPRSDAEKAEIRRELGWTTADRVVGFTGTFGGWHGIDVLAEALPRICQRAPNAKVLLIGDGSHKPIVDASVASHHLEDRVRSAGRVPQQEGARLLGACDIYVSPHNSHMVDSKFFGSPTKLFEYMAMGGGVVSSDLEQLGEVLSPALRVTDFARPDLQVTNQRAVLCSPGDVDEFTDAVVALVERPDVSRALGRNARQAVLDTYSWRQHVANVWRFLLEGLSGDAVAARRTRAIERLATGDSYKEEVQNQWNENPVGTQYAKVSRPHSLKWFKEIEAHRYGQYGPWMPALMEFDRHTGEDVLEIGGGIGTDSSQWASHGARFTDLDLSAGHLALAKENFAARGLQGRFVHHDAESLPFDDGSFDVVYSNGVLHHTPNTRQVVEEIYRVLRPGGQAIVMMYAENSLHYWRQLVWKLGLQKERLTKYSMGEIMSRYVEITQNDAKPLVKVYTARRLRRLFDGFEGRRVYKRQLTRQELSDFAPWMPLPIAERLMGWNVIIKARKPRTPRRA